MKDPVLDKLAADAGIVLADLWRALRHQPPVQEWNHPRRAALGEVPDRTEVPEPPKSGLCYFHLN